LTLRGDTIPQERAIAAMRESLNQGSNFWNGGEFYGSPQRNSLHLLHEYFTEFPTDNERVVLSMKGGFKVGSIEVDGSKENISRSIEECLRVLDGKKFIDIFQCARVDPNVPIEDTISYIAEYVKTGQIGGIGLSEVSAKTIRRAAKVHPIAAVEVELNLWSTQILENGVVEACAELQIPIIAYSPLGGGFLVIITVILHSCVRV
jgi:pyridoxine 4-dehydrogenase